MKEQSSTWKIVKQTLVMLLFITLSMALLAGCSKKNKDSDENNSPPAKTNSDKSKKDHPTKDHPKKDHPTKDHPKKDHPTKDHPKKDHPK